MSHKDHKITLRLSDEEYFILWCYTEHKHIGGPNPMNAFFKEAAFGYMTKYPIQDARKPELVKRFILEHPDAKAVQLSALPGKYKDE